MKSSGWTAPLALAVVVQCGSNAEAHTRPVDTVRSFSCGPMQLAANTTFIPQRTMHDQVLSQKITYSDRGTGASKNLDLQQNRAREPAFANALMIDAPAWGWSCTQGYAGEFYLTVQFNCENPNATLCSLDVQSGPVEWSITYDENGNALFPENRYVHEKDIKKLKQLGIYENAYESPRILGEIFQDDTAAATPDGR